MSAQRIYDLAPLGAVIRYSDGTPRPHKRFRKKLAAWENNNNSGRLVRKAAAHTLGNHTTPETITLHQGDFGSSGVIVLRVFKSFSVDSVLTFAVIEQPKPGSVRILDRQGELVHLAQDRGAAEAWFASHGYTGATLDEVTENEPVAVVAEGRAA